MRMEKLILNDYIFELILIQDNNWEIDILEQLHFEVILRQIV